MADIKFLKAQLNQQLFMISQPNEKVMEAAWQRWDSIGKPEKREYLKCHKLSAVFLRYPPLLFFRLLKASLCPEDESPPVL